MTEEIILDLLFSEKSINQKLTKIKEIIKKYGENKFLEGFKEGLKENNLLQTTASTSKRLFLYSNSLHHKITNKEVRKYA